MKLARSLALGSLLVLVGFATLPATADVDTSQFLLMEDLRVGMEGYGKTTVGGGDIRIFQTRIIGIVDNPGQLNDFYLVRSSGDLIREIGGYAQGMSGSPIYIDGKQIGAFFAAYLFDESPNPIGLVRPIEVMLNLVDRIDASVNQTEEAANLEHIELPLEEALDYVQIDHGGYEAVQFVSKPPSLAERQANPEVVYAMRTGTPLWVSGLSGRSLNWLKSGVDSRTLENFSSELFSIPTTAGRSFLDELQIGVEQRFGSEVFPLSTATADTGFFADEFEMGGSMAALLSQGDVTFGGVCTTSYIDPTTNTLLACGHQMFLSGETSLFLARSTVMDVVNSAQISFVLAQVDTSDVYGTVLEDRVQAIGASMDHQVDATKLSARVHDLTTDTKREIEVDLAPSQSLTASLVFASLLQVVDEALNRIGSGTMKVDYTIRGDGMSKRVSRSDVFVSFNDVALGGPLQAAQFVFLIDQNEFVDPEIDRIDIDITTTEDVRWLQIKEIETDKEIYHPGDTVRYIIVMTSYRGEERRISGEFDIPEETTVRRLTLHSFGGPRRAQQQSGQQTVQFENLDELLDALEKITGNDQLTIELLGLPIDPDNESTAPAAEIENLGDWVVTGEDRVNIQIEPRPEPEDETGENTEDPQTHEQPIGEEEEEDTRNDEEENNNSEESSEETPDEETEECEQLFYCN
jgi:hypothetical protein